jgi:hypothetical protein
LAAIDMPTPLLQIRAIEPRLSHRLSYQISESRIDRAVVYGSKVLHRVAEPAYQLNHSAFHHASVIAPNCDS